MEPSSQFWKLCLKFSKGGEWELRPRAYLMAFAHVMGIQGIYFLFSGQNFWQCAVFGFVVFFVGAIGGSAGGHRLWSHRSYKAKLPLRIALMIAQTLLGQESIYTWVMAHRLHHKYCETDADPHNVNRGIFFTHIGWILIKDHPAVTEHLKKIDMSDLANDPVVAIQHKYYLFFDFIFFHTIPVMITYYFWVPSIYICVCLNYIRFLSSHHVTSLGNSVAHTWNRKPYERNMGPADVSWLSLVLIGEGWHNFHHVFPWDYRSTDVGLYSMNWTTVFIDLMAKLGLAYDLKTVPDHVIRKRAARTGDGSHPHVNQGQIENDSSSFVAPGSKNALANREGSNNNVSIDKLDVGEIGPAPWGWGDSDIPEEDILETNLSHLKFM